MCAKNDHSYFSFSGWLINPLQNITLSLVKTLGFLNMVAELDSALESVILWPSHAHWVTDWRVLLRSSVLAVAGECGVHLCQGVWVGGHTLSFHSSMGRRQEPESGLGRKGRGWNWHSLDWGALSYFWSLTYLIYKLSHYQLDDSVEKGEHSICPVSPWRKNECVLKKKIRKERKWGKRKC